MASKPKSPASEPSSVPGTELATVQFHGQTLLTFEHNGEPHVALKPVCEAIGLDWEGQHSRLQRHEVLRSTISITGVVAEDGKVRQMVSLPLRHLNGWLFGVDAARVRAALRPTLKMYQAECFDVLSAYWQRGAAVNARMANGLEGAIAQMVADQIQRILPPVVEAIVTKLLPALGVAASAGESSRRPPPSRMMTADNDRARGKSHLHFVVPSSLHRGAKLYALRTGTTLGKLVAEALAWRVQKGGDDGQASLDLDR